MFLLAKNISFCVLTSSMADSKELVSVDFTWFFSTKAQNPEHFWFADSKCVCLFTFNAILFEEGYIKAVETTVSLRIEQTWIEYASCSMGCTEVHVKIDDSFLMTFDE